MTVCCNGHLQIKHHPGFSVSVIIASVYYSLSSPNRKLAGLVRLTKLEHLYQLPNLPIAFHALPTDGPLWLTGEAMAGN